MNNPYTRMFSSIYRGKVEDNEDPEKLGRCRVRVPSIHGELTYPVKLLPWARPLVLSPVKSKRGTVNIPDVGDIVWVMFEGAQKDFPIYLGGTYARDELEIDKDIVDFYVEEEDRIFYDRKNRVYTIQIGETKFTVSPEGMTTVGGVTEEEKPPEETDIIEFYTDENCSISYDKKTMLFSMKIGENEMSMSPEGTNILGNLVVTGDLVITGNLQVGGTTVLNDLLVNGICNKENKEEVDDTE